MEPLLKNLFKGFTFKEIGVCCLKLNQNVVVCGAYLPVCGPKTYDFAAIYKDSNSFSGRGRQVSSARLCDALTGKPGNSQKEARRTKEG